MSQTQASAGPAVRRLRLPPVMEQPGTRGWLAVLAGGAVLGAVTMIIPALLPAEAAFGFLAVLLGMIAGVYFGFALQDGRLREFRTEYVGIVAHGALATAALAWASPLLLATGYAGHALWDAVHHPRGIDTAIPSWYVPVCIGYDLVVAAYVLVRFA